MSETSQDEHIPASPAEPEPSVRDAGSSRTGSGPTRVRTILEWSLVIGLLLFLRFTPQGKTVIGWMQQGILATGLITPDIGFAEKNDVPAEYDVVLETLDGERVSLESMRGRVVFMNVWATWCAPCLAEMPYIQNLYKDVASRDIAFVMISVDESADAVRRHVESRRYSFPVYRALGPLPEPYADNTVPRTYVISADGELAAVHTGMSNVDTPEFRAFLRSLAGGDAVL